MAGYDVVKKVDDLRSLAKALGFVVKPYYGELGKSYVRLTNDSDAMPTYITREFIGTLEESAAFLQGMRYARMRDNEIGLVSYELRDSVIRQRIQEINNEHLKQVIESSTVSNE